MIEDSLSFCPTEFDLTKGTDTLRPEETNSASDETYAHQQTSGIAALERRSGQSGVGQLITTAEIVWKQVEQFKMRVSIDFRDYTLHDIPHRG